MPLGINCARLTSKYSKRRLFFAHRSTAPTVIFLTHSYIVPIVGKQRPSTSVRTSGSNQLAMDKCGDARLADPFIRADDRRCSLMGASARVHSIRSFLSFRAYYCQAGVRVRRKLAWLPSVSMRLTVQDNTTDPYTRPVQESTDSRHVPQHSGG
jgi:hypothetical protein